MLSNYEKTRNALYSLLRFIYEEQPAEHCSAPTCPICEAHNALRDGPPGPGQPTRGID